MTVQLAPTAVIHDRPFTDLRHTRYDLHALRFMISCACLALETLPTRLPAPNPSQSAGDSPRAACHAPSGVVSRANVKIPAEPWRPRPASGAASERAR